MASELKSFQSFQRSKALVMTNLYQFVCACA